MDVSLEYKGISGLQQSTLNCLLIGYPSGTDTTDNLEMTAIRNEKELHLPRRGPPRKLPKWELLVENIVSLETIVT